uniref:Uncharacterized protein n=1 Tax=Anguilla anguilla TaxID=7936 RepID=A0A0E9SUE3_ANGAN
MRVWFIGYKQVTRFTPQVKAHHTWNS